MARKGRLMNVPSDRVLRVAIYARVSTSDKEQNVETQLLPLREFVQAQGWEIYRAYIDLASATDLERLRGWGVGLRSYSEPWLDTTSPFGEALYYITVAYAQLERGILRERVKAGMDRARRQGRQIGRPRVTDRKGFNKRIGAILEHLNDGSISRRRAAKELNIGYATLKRLLDAQSSGRAD